MLIRIMKKLKYYWYLLINADNIVINGVKMNIQHEQITSEIKKYFYSGSYEFDEINVIANALETSDKVLELGAGIGFVSTFAAKKLGNENVFAFEANPFMIEKIEETYKLNSVSPKIFNIFLSDKEGDMDFYLDKNFWSSSSIKKDLRKMNKISVPMKNINDYVQSFQPTTLIMDIEGGEVDLLPIIDFKNNKITKIMIELHPTVIGDLQASLLVSKLVNEGFYLNFEYSRSNVLFLQRVLS